MSLFSRHISYGPPLRMSPWRKIAVGTWQDAGDPSVYGYLDFDVGPALEYIEKARTKTGARVTLSHFVGKAIAEILKRHPDINCMLRFGKLYPRTSVDLFFQVASDMKGEDLSGTTIRGADKKSIVQIASEMEERVKAIREKRDLSFAKVKGTMGAFPGWMAGFLLNLTSLITYTFNLWSPLLGTPRDPFGSVMITNIGSLGLDMAFAPLVPYSRVPLLIAVGAARDAALVRNGQVVAGKMIRLCATFDHRLIDGVHASHMSKTLHAIFANPTAELGEA